MRFVLHKIKQVRIQFGLELDVPGEGVLVLGAGPVLHDAGPVHGHGGLEDGVVLDGGHLALVQLERVERRARRLRAVEYVDFVCAFL